MSLSDSDLIEQFEALTLPPSVVNHVNHLRIAWLYLVKLELNQAIEKITTGTKEYAAYLGDNEIYHRTVTEAVTRIMYLRMR